MASSRSDAETVFDVDSHLAHPFPSVVKGEDGRFDIVFEKNGAQVVLDLDLNGLRMLAHCCVENMPPIDPAPARPEVNAYYRETLAWLLRSTSADIQALLRMVSTSDWINALWFMKDRSLIDRFLDANLPALREMLLEDLVTRWAGKDPDHCLEFEARMGHRAVRVINRAAQELAESGAL